MRVTVMVALSLVMAGSAAAQIPASAPSPRATGAFFAVSVGDLDMSRAWYEGALGLRVTSTQTPNNGMTIVILEGGGLIVELIRSPRALVTPGADPQTQRGLFKVGVVVANYDALLARIHERAVPLAFGPFPARNGQRPNFGIRDPDGTLIQFFGQ